MVVMDNFVSSLLSKAFIKYKFIIYAVMSRFIISSNDKALAKIIYGLQKHLLLLD